MKRRIIKITIIALVAALLIGGGFGLYFKLRPTGVTGQIDFGAKYYLSELRKSNYFEGADMNKSSYFKINEDQQTGELYLVGLSVGKLDFIVTQYHEGAQNTTFTIEFIYKNTLHQLSAASTTTEIRFHAILPHSVYVTKEDPDPDLRALQYNVTLMVFKPEVLA